MPRNDESKGAEAVVKARTSSCCRFGTHREDIDLSDDPAVGADNWHDNLSRRGEITRRGRHG